MRIWAWNCVQAHRRCAQADARQWSYGYGYGYYGYKRRNRLATSLAVSLPMRARSRPRPRAPWRVEWPLPRCGVRCAARWVQRVEEWKSPRESGQQRSRQSRGGGTLGLQSSALHHIYWLPYYHERSESTQWKTETETETEKQKQYKKLNHVLINIGNLVQLQLYTQVIDNRALYHVIYYTLYSTICIYRDVTLFPLTVESRS